MLRCVNRCYDGVQMFVQGDEVNASDISEDIMDRAAWIKRNFVDDSAKSMETGVERDDDDKPTPKRRGRPPLTEQRVED